MSALVPAAADDAAPPPSAVRKEGDPAVSGEGAKRASKRVKGMPAVDYNGDGTPSAISAEAQAESDSRAFWETYSTPLIWAWLQDFGGKKKGITKADEHDREKIIRYLVLHRALYPQPKAPKQLQMLQDVWRHRHKKKPADAAPDLHQDQEEEKQQEQDREQEEDDGEMSVAEQGQPPQSMQLIQPSPSSFATPATRKAQSPRLTISSPQQRQQLERERQQMQEAYRASLADLQQQEDEMDGKCQTCLVPRPAAAGGKAWVCVCGLRGDLPADAAANVVLLRMMPASAPVPPAGWGGSPASAAAAGMHTAADTAARQTSKLEKEFRHKASLGPPVPAFALPALPDPTAEAAVVAVRARCVAAALEQGRKAYGADKFVAPIPDLIALIQSGKLAQLGHALPKLIGDAPAADNSWTVNEQGALTATATGTAAPPLASLSEFFTALHATILPALVNQPAAIAQWCAVARTVLVVNEKFGWECARNYVTVLLYERILTGSDFAAVHHPALFEFSVSKGLTGSPPASSGAPPRHKDNSGRTSSSQGGNAGKSSDTCHRYNSASGCPRPAAECRFVHACSKCKATSHGLKKCPSRTSTPSSATVGSVKSAGDKV